MLSEIILFEFRSWVRNKNTYIFFALLFGLGFLLTNYFGMALRTNFFIILNPKVDSPTRLNDYLTTLTFIGTFVTSMIMGLAVYKDYQYNTFAITFTSAASKFNYLAGRFGGAIGICLIIAIGPFLGFAAGVFAPWTAMVNFEKSQFGAYLYTYLSKAVPMVFYTGALFFALSTLLKNTLFNWLVIGLLYALHTSLNGIYIDPDLEHMQRSIAMFDPWGVLPDRLAEKGWSIPDRNDKLIPITSLTLINRAIWMGIGVLALIITYFKIDLHARQGKFKLFGLIKRKLTDSVSTKGFAFGAVNLPLVQQKFNFSSFSKITWILTWKNIKRIIFHPFFILLLVGCYLYLKYSTRSFGTAWGTSSYPFTYLILQQFASKAHLFIIMTIAWFSGEIIWRDRHFRTNQINDTYPVPNRVHLISSFGALLIIPLFFLILVMITGIGAQKTLGFEEYEIGLYLKDLFVIRYIDYLLYTLLALFLFSLFSNKYLTIFLLIIYYVLEDRFLNTLIPHKMLLFGSDPGLTYSEFTGYANTLYPYFLFKAYWLAFAGLISMLTNRIWSRGTDEGLRSKWLQIKERLAPGEKVAAASFGSMFLMIGGIIFYNIYGLGNYQSSDDSDSAYYEKTYKQYEELPLPKITHVFVQADLYPDSQDYRFTGHYWVKNKTDQPIKQMIINYPTQFETETFEFSRNATEQIYDDNYGLHLYEFDQALSPGDSMKIDFQFFREVNGFSNNSGDMLRSKPISNGTFMNNRLLPTFGYQAGRELVFDEQREKYGLAPKNNNPIPAGDPVGQRENWLSDIADFIHFETIVSTKEGQVAIAPGYLQRQWSENGREFFHYKMDAPIQNFYSFVSGEYKVYSEEWKGKSLEIYHHPRHDYNLEKMMDAMKKSLDYYAENFSPYQYRQMRIIEFPRFLGSFAQSFPNTVPFSEGIGFTSDLRKLGQESVGGFTFTNARRDVPFYVTAHEVAHQWWAHQVTSGNVEGYNFLSEAMSQYAALMVTEKEYGKDGLRDYLKYEMNRYLNGRQGENLSEKPLIRARGGQSYIHYGKGAIAMYALQSYIGEDSLNTAIKRFVEKNAFQEPPYTNSVEFLEEVRKVTPDSLSYILDEWFDDIILFDNKIVSATYERTEDFDYIVEFELDLNKVRADEEGNETAIPINDYIEVSIMNDRNKVLYLEKIKFTEGKATFNITVSRKPDSIVIDPYYHLIDKDLNDNEFKIERKE